MKNSADPVPFTKDKPIFLLAVFSGLLASLNLLLTVVRLKSHDFKVPVQYVVNDGSVLQTSNWYTLYTLALFSILSAGVVIFLARRLHQGNRVFAAGLLGVYAVVGIITLLATNALLGLVSRV